MTWDDFILKMRQGEAINISEKRNDISSYGERIIYSIPINQSVKIVYNNRLDGRFDSNNNEFFGIVDCNNNKLFLEDCSCLRNSEEYKKYKALYLDLIDLENSQNIESYETLKNEVLDYAVHMGIDDFIIGLDENEKNMLNKDIVFNDLKEYSDIQILGMGLNNYLCYKLLSEIYKSERKYGDQWTNSKLVITYLDKGIDGLKELYANYRDDFECWSSPSIGRWKNEYIELCDKYKNIDKNYVDFLHNIIKEVSKDKNTVTMNGEKVKNFSVNDSYKIIKYQDSSCKSWETCDCKPEDVETLEYRGKEIYNRDKVLSYIQSPEYQAGINELIEYVRNDFNKYNETKQKVSELNWSAGDLVYTQDGNFGVVVGTNKVYLDNGILKNIDPDKSMSDNSINIFVSKSEFNKGLSQIQSLVGREYFNKNVKKQGQKQVIEMER